MIWNSSTRWGSVAKVLHWVGAGAILMLLIHGWWMTHVTPRPDRLAHYAWHAALGYDLLALFVLRVLWRWVNPVPQLPAETKAWERMAAHAGHVGLYVLTFAVCVTGWAVAATFRTPLVRDLFGLSVWTPTVLTSLGRSLRDAMENAHRVLAYVLAALIVLHVVGALRHHFIKKNDVLRRML